LGGGQVEVVGLLKIIVSGSIEPEKKHLYSSEQLHNKFIKSENVKQRSACENQRKA
jgi:hypothetical protein